MESMKNAEENIDSCALRGAYAFCDTHGAL